MALKREWYKVNINKTISLGLKTIKVEKGIMGILYKFPFYMWERKHLRYCMISGNDAKFHCVFQENQRDLIYNDNELVTWSKRYDFAIFKLPDNDKGWTHFRVNYSNLWLMEK